MSRKNLCQIVTVLNFIKLYNVLLVLLSKSVVDLDLKYTTA